ncbi:hypothetical protein TNCV_310311 [Trichonephila clavipes]|nr:hypothetical protein TNCV_310311 [Trichonephila clavipes]
MTQVSLSSILSGRQLAVDKHLIDWSFIICTVLYLIIKLRALDDSTFPQNDDAGRLLENYLHKETCTLWIAAQLSGFNLIQSSSNALKIRAPYEGLSEFERGRIIGLKDGSWENRRMSRHMGRGDAAIRRGWQKWVDIG